MFLHACPVQKSERQRFVYPMSGLLFCTTCCLAQPCLEKRGGWERQAMICHPWFVTMLHQIPFSFLPSLWFQVAAEHPQRFQQLNWLGADFNTKESLGSVCSNQLASLWKPLIFPAVFVHLGYRAPRLKGRVNKLHMTFHSFSINMAV